MTKLLPYFKWYPADALSDVDYMSFTMEELGLYHLLLNYSWVNGGIPADPLEISRLVRLEKQKFNRIWARVSRKFQQQVPHPGGYLLGNPRQELEKQDAHQKSVKCSESVKTRYERNTNDLPRARASDSDSDTDSEKERRTLVSLSEVLEPVAKKPVVRVAPSAPGQEKPPAPHPPRTIVHPPTENSETSVATEIPDFSPVRKLETRKPPETGSQRFLEWLSVWPAVADRDGACRAWISRVTPGDEEAAFACRDRYLASEQVSRGIIQEPKKFIMVQADSQWSGTWINESTQLDPNIAVLREIDRKLKEEDDANRRNGSKGANIKTSRLTRVSETAGRLGINPSSNGNLH